MLNVLITRPIKDAVITAREFKKVGFFPIVEPLIKIVKEKVIKISRPCVLIITSSNALECVECEDKNIRVYCVGEKTSLLAKDKGFKNIFYKKNIQDLIDFILIQDLDKKDVFYLRGNHITTDFGKTLLKAGINIKEEVVYNSVTTEKFSKDLLSLLALNEIDLVTFYSSRTAKSFVDKIINMNLTYKCENMVALAISDKVKKQLNRLNWKEIFVSDKPDAKSLIKKAKFIKDNG